MTGRYSIDRITSSADNPLEYLKIHSATTDEMLDAIWTHSHLLNDNEWAQYLDFLSKMEKK